MQLQGLVPLEPPTEPEAVTCKVLPFVLILPDVNVNVPEISMSEDKVKPVELFTVIFLKCGCAEDEPVILMLSTTTP